MNLNSSLYSSLPDRYPSPPSPSYPNPHLKRSPSREVEETLCQQRVFVVFLLATAVVSGS